VVGWGTDQPNPDDRMSVLSNVLGDLVAGKLTSLSGFGTLRHLYLQIIAVRYVGAGHAKPTRGNLQKELYISFLKIQT